MIVISNRGSGTYRPSRLRVARIVSVVSLDAGGWSELQLNLVSHHQQVTSPISLNPKESSISPKQQHCPLSKNTINKTIINSRFPNIECLHLRRSLSNSQTLRIQRNTSRVLQFGIKLNVKSTLDDRGRYLVRKHTATTSTT